MIKQNSVDSVDVNKLIFREKSASGDLSACWINGNPPIIMVDSSVITNSAVNIKTVIPQQSKKLKRLVIVL